MKEEEVYHIKILKALQSKEYISVRRRVFRQLVESLIYEKIITPIHIQKGEQILFIIQGLDEKDQNVMYQCYGQERMTFGRICLHASLIMRVQDEEEKYNQFHNFYRRFFELFKWIERNWILLFKN